MCACVHACLHAYIHSMYTIVLRLFIDVYILGDFGNSGFSGY